MRKAIFRARWLLLPDFSLLENGALCCEDGRIAAVEKFPSLRARFDYPVIDFDDAVILPGLINAHCHLEFTLPSAMIKRTSLPDGKAGDFIEWLKHIVPLRMAIPPAVASVFAAQGIAELVRAGTTTIADISSSDISIAPLREAFVRAAIFFEVIDMQLHTAEASLAALAQRYEALGEMSEVPPAGNEAGSVMREASARLLSGGISPHASYSVSERLLRAIVEWRQKKHARFAVHLAETPEEVAMIRDGAGAMYDHLRELSFLPDDWSPKGVTPVRYLYDLGVLDASSLLVHCNYVTPEDIALIAAARSSVAYCPGSHRFFSHSRHPLPELLRAGVNVCLGTDSRASNESLDMLREMRLVKEEFPEIEWETIVRLATSNAARALGLENVTGRLAPGYACDLTVLNPRGERRLRHVADIFLAAPPTEGHAPPTEGHAPPTEGHAPPTVRATIVAGEVLFDAASAPR